MHTRQANFRYLSIIFQVTLMERLQKMSSTLYALKVNLEKKKDRDKNQAAITDYDRDLKFLKFTYYDGRFNFAWPDW